jgi:hypothetical protein
MPILQANSAHDCYRVNAQKCMQSDAALLKHYISLLQLSPFAPTVSRIYGILISNEVIKATTLFNATQKTFEEVDKLEMS